jgi:hypothetical protein
MQRTNGQAKAYLQGEHGERDARDQPTSVSARTPNPPDAAEREADAADASNPNDARPPRTHPAAHLPAFQLPTDGPSLDGIRRSNAVANNVMTGVEGGKCVVKTMDERRCRYE